MNKFPINFNRAFVLTGLKAANECGTRTGLQFPSFQDGSLQKLHDLWYYNISLT